MTVERMFAYDSVGAEMKHTKIDCEVLEAIVGYAADPRGRGVAYARVCCSNGSRHLLRVSFKMPAGDGVGYAALTAVARSLHDRGVRKARMAVADAALVEEIGGIRQVPPALALANVRLRCAFNRLGDCSVQLTDDGDLGQRARAEVFLAA